jgi:hypothetical protein
MLDMQIGSNEFNFLELRSTEEEDKKRNQLAPKFRDSISVLAGKTNQPGVQGCLVGITIAS